MIRVVTCDVRGCITVQLIDPTLEAMQRIVGGYIAIVRRRIAGYRVDVVIHEEGRLLGLSPNPAFARDGLLGDVFVTETDAEGEPRSLTPEAAGEIVASLSRRLEDDEGAAILSRLRSAS